MNYFAIGFGAVALVAVGAIDYANQANAAGEAPGSYGAGAYFATYGARMGAVREARNEAADAKARDALRTAGARVYLPPAPEGWTRRAWLAGDNSAITAPVDDAFLDDTPDLLKKLAAKSAKSAEERRDAETWVYQKDGAIVALRAKYKPRDDARSLGTALADTINMVAARPQSGWAVIDGVAYGRSAADFGDPDAPVLSQAGTPYFAYEAPIGMHDAVRISVASNAGDADLRSLLSAIDYDGLNGLLSYPLDHIGSNAADVPLAAQPQVANLMLELHSDLAAQRGAEAQAWIARATTPENAMTLMMNELATGWGAGGIASLDPGAKDQAADTEAVEVAAQQDTKQSLPGIGSIRSMTDFAASLFGGGSGGSAAPSEAQAAVDPAPAAPQAAKPKRLKLSGGSSCLTGSAGKFCRD